MGDRVNHLLKKNKVLRNQRNHLAQQIEDLAELAREYARLRIHHDYAHHGRQPGESSPSDFLGTEDELR